MPVFLLVIIAALLGGVLPVAIKIGVAELSPLLFAAARFALSALILLPLMNELRRSRLLAALSDRATQFSVVANSGNIIFFVFAIHNISPVLAQTMYLLCPLLIYVGEVFFFGDKFSLRSSLGIALGFLGAAIAIFGYHSFDGGLSLQGLFYMVLAILAYAAFGLASRRVRHKLGSLEQTFAMSVAVVGFSLLVSFLEYPPQQAFDWSSLSTSLILSVLYTGIMGGAVFYAILQQIIRRSDATTAAMVIYLQPFAVIVASYLLIGETVILLGVLGAVISIMGAYLVTSRQNPTEV